MKGLKQRILEAGNEEEVRELLKEGSGWRDASPSTVRKWNRAALSRIQELTAPSKVKRGQK